MNRKQFIKLSAAASAGMLLPTPMLGKAFSLKDISSGSTFEVLIIGTGYGAAVTALRLAQKGIKCLLLEMGMDWQKSGIAFSGMAFPKKQSTWLRNTSIAPFGNFVINEKFTGVLDRIDFEHINIYAGRGVGGGSLVNGAMSVTPKRSYFEEILPELDSEKFYSKYFPLANNELGVTTMPEEYYNKSPYYEFSRKGEEEGKKAGYKTVKVPSVYDYDYMQKEEAGTVTKSALNGEVIYGNNHGKKDLTKTYIKKALDTGNVSILPLHKADQIFKNDDNTYSVSVQVINTKGETIENKVYKTKKLFLGAGSIGTTELLLKSKAKGSLNTLNNEVGKYWGNNGNVMTGRNFVNGGTGNKQSTMPAAGIEDWKKTLDAFFAEIAPLPIGMETLAALYLVINRIKTYGEFTYDTKSDTLKLHWNKTHTAHMKDNVERFVNSMNKANGGTIAGLLFDKGIGTNICYHPLGGCVIGKATDLYGRVKGCKGLYVTDGALIPGTIGVNPYVTITAIAEHNIDNIIATDFKSKTTNVKESLLELSVFPVPFKNELTVSFENIMEQECTITIHNWIGRILEKKVFTAKKGTVKYKIDNLDRLWNGTYVVTVTIGNITLSKKVVK